MFRILQPFLLNPTKHLYRLLVNPQYRTYYYLTYKLRGKSRYKNIQVRINGWDISAPDCASLISQYKEIFFEEVYAFAKPSNSQTLNILDVGANIGLSILYFKDKYPFASVVALEADPFVFDFLRQNLRANDIKDVDLLNVAAWTEATTLSFQQEGADAGRIMDYPEENSIDVKAIDFKSLLESRDFDLLKMDIEGAETLILEDSKAYLSHLRYVVIEYHSIYGQDQQLGSLIKLLENAGFRVCINPVWVNRRPLVEWKSNSYGFDYQALIYGRRELS